MKKLTFMLALIAMVFCACNSNTSKDTATAVYICPMDPDVISNKPGTCPKCKMDLVVQQQAEEDRSQHNH